MTQIEVGTLPANTVPVWVSRAGAVCLAAGILGAVSGILLAVYPGQVSERRSAIRSGRAGSPSFRFGSSSSILVCSPASRSTVGDAGPDGEGLLCWP